MKKDNMVDTNYYMIITTPTDYRFDIKNELKFIGFPERNRMSVMKFKKGDRVAVYVTKCSCFAAVLEVTGDPYVSRSQVWEDEFFVYPYRVPTRPIYYSKLFRDTAQMVFIKDIWDNLEFINNKQKWGSQVQGSYRKINKHDYLVIEKALLNINRRK